MESPISLIVGLGNPGPEYEKTRHNAGAWYVEALARQYNQPLRPDSKYHGRHARLLIEGKPVFLLIPDTFMNLSGKAISALANFYRIPVTEILVAHDELDLLPGLAKLKRGGGHGGHNGLRDTITKMGNNKEFLRLRIGIGHPGSKDRVTGHVLGKAPSSEQQLIDAAIDEALRCTPILIGKGLHPAMNRLNSFNANS